MSDFHPHSDKQEQAIFSQKPLVICATGIQWGKTNVGALKTKLAIHQFTHPTDNFLITAPTYKIMQQSTLPAFKTIMEGCGHYSKVDACFRINGGGTVWLRTATDPDSVVGVTNIRFVWGDEAGKYGLYFWENLQARAAFKDAQIILTTSPYSLNWIFRDYIRPRQKDPMCLPDVDLIQARSDENPYFPADVYAARKKSMDARRFNMMFGGAWDKMEGLVYDCFSESENQIDPFELPSGTKFYAGVDWGHRHPFVILVHALTPDGRHFQVSEVYKTGLTLQDMVLLAKAKKRIWNIERFVADPSQPGYIAEFNRHKLTCVGANNDIRYGCDMVYELLKTRRLKFFSKTSPHTIDELETYHYPDHDDLSANKDLKEYLPVKQHDDAMDAMRYLIVDTHRSVQPMAPRKNIEDLPKHDIFKRIEIHKKNKRKAPFTEKWS